MIPLNTNKSIRVKGQRHLDDKYFDPSTNAPYVSTADALAKINANERVNYLKVNIGGVDYWLLPDGTLVQYIGSLSLVDGSVTLVKQANVPTSTVFYRKSAGDGPPEVQTFATLKTDLGLTPDLSLYVLITPGYDLAPDQMIIDYPSMLEAINALPTTYVAIASGYSLIANTELARLALIYQTIRITLPAGSLASKVAGAASGTDYPTGWTIAVSGTTDLLVTHTLTGLKIVDVKVYEIDLTGERLLTPFADAYSGILGNTGTVLIEGVASTLALRMELTFN